MRALRLWLAAALALGVDCGIQAQPYVSPAQDPEGHYYEQESWWADRGHAVEYPDVRLTIVEATSRRPITQVQVRIGWPARVGTLTQYQWDCRRGAYHESMLFLDPPHGEVNFTSPYYIVPSTNERPMCIKLTRLEPEFSETFQLVRLHKGNNAITLRVTSPRSPPAASAPEPARPLGRDLWQEVRGVPVNNSMRNVQLPEAVDIRPAAVYENDGNPLLEWSIEGYRFSLIYETRSGRFWGLAFPFVMPSKSKEVIDWLRGSDDGMNTSIERDGAIRQDLNGRIATRDRIEIRHESSRDARYLPLRMDLVTAQGEIQRGPGLWEPRFGVTLPGVVFFERNPNFAERVHVRRVRLGPNNTLVVESRLLLWSGPGSFQLPQMSFVEIDGDLGVSERSLDGTQRWPLQVPVRKGHPGTAGLRNTAVLVYQGKGPPEIYPPR